MANVNGDSGDDRLEGNDGDDTLNSPGALVTIPCMEMPATITLYGQNGDDVL